MLPAREQIERLIFIYAEALDAGDINRVATLFLKGRITVDGQTKAMEGAAEVKSTLMRYTRFYDDQGKKIDPLLQKGKPFTRHITTNLFFEELGASHAKTHSCFTVVQGLPGREIKAIISGRYIDQFACDQGNWLFVERRECIDLVGDLSEHLNLNPF